MNAFFFAGKKTLYNFCKSDPLTPLKLNLWIIHDKQILMFGNATTIPFLFPPSWDRITRVSIITYSWANLHKTKM